MKEIIESLKYKSEVFKIAGFALLTPVGGVILNPLLYRELGLSMFIPYFLFCSVFAGAGLVSIMYGYNILRAEDKPYGDK